MADSDSDTEEPQETIASLSAETLAALQQHLAGKYPLVYMYILVLFWYTCVHFSFMGDIGQLRTAERDIKFHRENLAWRGAYLSRLVTFEFFKYIVFLQRLAP